MIFNNNLTGCIKYFLYKLSFLSIYMLVCTLIICNSSYALEPKTNTKTKTAQVTTTKYYDLDNKNIAKEINFELLDEQENILQDLRILWQAAAQNSETIKFAIYKLSKPDGEKIDENMVKKILEPIANIAPMIGANMANPAVAGSSILGGGILGSVL